MKRATKDSHFPKYSQSDWTVAKIIFTSSILASCSAFPCSLFIYSFEKFLEKRGRNEIRREERQQRQTDVPFLLFFPDPEG